MSFLPTIDPLHIQQAIHIIQSISNPTGLSPQTVQTLSNQLLDYQKTTESWGLITPLLTNPDENVQFFGAQILLVKVNNGLEAGREVEIKDWVLRQIIEGVQRGIGKVVIGKLFVTICALAFKLSSGWPSWITSTIEILHARQIPLFVILQFLRIVPEEIDSATLSGTAKSRLKDEMREASESVVLLFSDAVAPQLLGESSHREKVAAYKCLIAWIPQLTANHLTNLIPSLLSSLTVSDEGDWTHAAETLMEILGKSSFRDGAGSKIITEPLLWYLATWGVKIVQNAVEAQDCDAVATTLCKLIMELGDHSAQYFASNLASVALVPPPSTLFSSPTAPRTKAELIQCYLKLVLAYTDFPGHYATEEFVSEQTLAFWYLFQEALWNNDYYFEDGSNQAAEEAAIRNAEQGDGGEGMKIAKQVYADVVRALRRKVCWPVEIERWRKDEKDMFGVYRRDVGDTLINAYYVLREDMLAFYIRDLSERMAYSATASGWEEIEATLHCISSIQEAVQIEENPHLSALFSASIIGQLHNFTPASGANRLRRTMLGVIEVYASWFTTVNGEPSLLLNAMTYIVSALSDPSLCLSAATALQSLCDSNRMALSTHMSSFSDLHAGVSELPEAEREKVLQSIASVIQALPALNQIQPVLGILNPILENLASVITTHTTGLDEQSRDSTVSGLNTIAGVCKGLTRANDPMLDEDPAVEQVELESITHARNDGDVARLREKIFYVVRIVTERFGLDATVADALSGLIKSITTIVPSDINLLSLPVPPLLQVVALGLRRHFTGQWLSLTSALVVRLDPPTIFATTIVPMKNEEAGEAVRQTLPVLLESSVGVLIQPGVAAEQPDTVQAFFGCMDTIAKNFVEAFYTLPPEGFDTIIRLSTAALALQERYSLTHACSFLGTLISRTSARDELAEGKIMLATNHGRTIMAAVLNGVGGVAPRSAMPNFVELLSTLLSRYPTESQGWITQILLSNDFSARNADPKAKEIFMKHLLGSTSIRRTRDAVQQFALAARGLNGSTFGYGKATAA